MSTWEEKRKEILARDNFTCQNCGMFNPELGMVQFLNKTENEVELHEYENHPDPAEAVYRISQSKTGYTFSISFGNCWPVFPILQVHHKKYITGREQWDYPNGDLITLCKNCHTDLHKNESIPIYDPNSNLVEEKMFVPVDNGCGRKHHCDDWTFIQKIGGGEYLISNITPTITVFLFEHEDQIEVFREGNRVLEEFISTFFPRYSRK